MLYGDVQGIANTPASNTDFYQTTATLTLPTLILQGTGDELVKPHLTRQLLQRLPGPIQYSVLAAAHVLLDATRPAWPTVEMAVTRFAVRMLAA